ncbi:MAG: hypothetical protein BGO49_05220 [Planctomycetales bacterium 71-10]|nr:MAG: hypothetical protein BGO49_05220 [Planctomycetales bacterium 71-10]
MTDDPKSRTLRVHLIAYAPTPTATPPSNRPYAVPGLIEDAPTYRARITLRDAPRAARAANASTVATIDGRSVAAIVDDVREVVSIEY